MNNADYWNIVVISECGNLKPDPIYTRTYGYLKEILISILIYSEGNDSKNHIIVLYQRKYN